MVLTLALFFSCGLADRSASGARLDELALIESTASESMNVGTGDGDVRTGDFDADGLIDLVVFTTGSLAASVYWGSGGGLSGTPTVVTMDGPGTAPAAVLDANGDGYDDLAVATDDAIEIHAGEAGGLSAPVVLTGVAVPLGLALNSVGDVDGDGDDELAVGNLSAGQMDVYLGSPSGLSVTPALSVSPAGASEFGRTAVNVGDVNDDGYPDVVAGSNDAWLIPGSAAGLDVANMVSVPVAASGYGAASGIAALGDTNGDGFPDFAVGGPNGPLGSSDGQVRVYLGGAGPLSLSPLVLKSPSATPAAFGRSIDSVGDLDDDGYADMVVGSSEGQAYVYWGTAAGLDATPAVLDASVAGEWVFNAASLDTNDDGYPDIVAGGHSLAVYLGYADDDGDGFVLGGDGTDQDCDDDDGTVGATIAWYADTDGDSYGDPAVSVVACEAPDGYVADNTDCDDDEALAIPGGTEICNGIDDDCDGTPDDGVGATAWYLDDDGDSYGDPAVSVVACEAPVDHVADNNDCDDQEPLAIPGGTEICNGIDDDCDGTPDDGVETSWYADIDGDNFGDPETTVVACVAPPDHVADNSDCDDDRALSNPDGTETCNGFDDDCDGTPDDGFPGETFYADTDGDGFGDPDASVTACVAPEGYVSDNTDCDDTAEAVNPEGTEVCNGVNDDCDGETDEDGAPVTWHQDGDGDSYGNSAVSQTSCTQPSGYVLDNTDCDDVVGAVNPGATEVCNGINDDCDGATDEEATDMGLFYEDGDGDGFGDEAGTVTASACMPPEGFAATADDCDDNDDEIFPGAVETCNDEDDDCDGQVDDNPPEGDPFYRDNDDDNYGNPNDVRRSCDFAPDGYVADNTDCDDGRSSVYPGADETCNNRDDDCDGTNDNDPTDPATFYVDTDGDGFGNPEDTVQACKKPIATVAGGTDCDDADPQSYPGAEDVPGDGIDQDCDGVDEGGGGDEKDEPKGCGCESGGSGASVGWLFALALLGLRRRR